MTLLNSKLRLSHLAAVVVLLSLAAGCGKPAADKPKRTTDVAVPVTVATVTSVAMDRTLPVVGTLFAKDEATVSAEVEGQTERTFAEFGDRLTNGQLIAQINTTTYLALSLQAAANVSRAKAALGNAEQQLRRLQQLSKSKIAAQSELDQSVAEAEQARAEVKSAEASEAIASLNLERSHVKAPFDAAVADRIASAGDFMRIGTPLFRIVNDGVLKYIVQAPERYAAQVQKEQLVRFTVDAWPGETFEGKVFLISPQVNTATRSFAFGALVPNKERRLRANTFARGEVVLERGTLTPMIPVDAVINFAGVTKVFVVENGIAHNRSVKVGRINNGMEEVLGGVKPGELVVTTGQTKLFEGAKVRVKESAGEPVKQVIRTP